MRDVIVRARVLSNVRIAPPAGREKGEAKMTRGELERRVANAVVQAAHIDTRSAINVVLEAAAEVAQHQAELVGCLPSRAELIAARLRSGITAKPGDEL